LLSGLADALDDGVDFLLGGFLGHVDDHGLVSLCEFVVFVKTKAAIRGSRLAEACLV
jgi:hypothetical protein